MKCWQLTIKGLLWFNNWTYEAFVWEAFYALNLICIQIRSNHFGLILIRHRRSQTKFAHVAHRTVAHPFGRAWFTHL